MKSFLLILLFSFIYSNTQAQDVVVDEDLINAWVEQLELLIGEETEWNNEEESFVSQENLWNVINIEDLNNDVELQDNLELAVEYLLDWGVQEGILDPAADFQLDTVNLIDQDQNNKTLHYFFLDLKNDQGDLERFAVDVYIDPVTGEKKLEYPASIQPILIGERGTNFLERHWPISLTWQQFQDNDYDANEVFAYGINNIVNRAVDEGVLLNSNYYVDYLFVAAVDQTPEATHYLFGALIKPQDLPLLEAIFQIREDPDGELEVEKYVLFPLP